MRRAGGLQEPRLAPAAASQEPKATMLEKKEAPSHSACLAWEVAEGRGPASPGCASPAVLDSGAPCPVPGLTLG